MIYRRLTVRNSARHAAVVFPVVTGIGGLLFFSRLLGDVGALPLSPALIGVVFSLTLIKYAPQLLILSVFAGVFIAMRQFFLRREMDAWFSAGVGLRAFAAPVLLFALPGVVFVGVFSLYGAPWAINQINIARAAAAIEVNADSLPQERFVDFPGGVYTYFWDGDGDIFIARNGGGAGGGEAREVIFTRSLKSGDGQILSLRDGHLHRLAPVAGGGATSETMRFDEINLSLPAVESAHIPPRAKKTAALNARAPAERAELVWRFSLPLAAAVLALLSLLLAPPNARFGGRHGYLSAIFVFFLYINLLRYVKEQVENGAFDAATALLLPPLAVAAAVWLVMGAFRRL